LKYFEFLRGLTNNIYFQSNVNKNFVTFKGDNWSDSVTSLYEKDQFIPYVLPIRENIKAKPKLIKIPQFVNVVLTLYSVAISNKLINKEEIPEPSFKLHFDFLDTGGKKISQTVILEWISYYTIIGIKDLKRHHREISKWHLKIKY
jgi:hypothetical protein